MNPTVWNVDDPPTGITLSTNTFTRDGYVFKGWNTDSTASSAEYADQAEIAVPDADVTLYAVWEQNAPIVATAEGFTGPCDGVAHGITVTVTVPESGATIRYGTSEGTYDLTESPTITNVSDSPLTVYYKVTADGYTETTGSAIVTINKVDGSIVAPTAGTLTYNGAAQALVTAGTVTGGELQYALGTETEPTAEWSTSIPTGIDAGTYYVWYKVVGDANHKDIDPACVTATISEKTTTATEATKIETPAEKTETPAVTVIAPKTSEESVSVRLLILFGSLSVTFAIIERIHAFRRRGEDFRHGGSCGGD